MDFIKEKISGIEISVNEKSKRIIDIKIKNEHEDSKSNADKNINSCWTVKLALPIGAIGKNDVRINRLIRKLYQ